jgi:hypothetical protein
MNPFQRLTVGITLLVALASIFVISSFQNTKDEVCLSPKEMELFNSINEYRKANGLSPIKLSKSLCKVAQAHAYDLSYNRPFSSTCNMHSWSDKGKWTSCCYTADHKQAQCMWNKPRELSNYKGDGFEISHGFQQFDSFSGDTVTVKSSLEGWKNSKGHNNVILNKEIWAKMKWNAIGIGINRDFSCVWFGTEEDTETEPKGCN